MSGPRKPWGGVWSLFPAVAGVAIHFVLREVLNPLPAVEPSASRRPRRAAFI
jgi:hypothetical protein